MVYADGDISLFLGYEKIEFTAPVYVGDFMEYVGWIEEVGNQSYKCKFEAVEGSKQCLIVQMRIWKESSIQLQQHVNHQSLRNRNRKFIYCEERPERTTGRII